MRGFTFRAVAAEAGVNHTLINHHFGSMQALLVATTEWVVERSIEETGLALFADSSEEFAETLISSAARNPELQMFQLEIIIESRRQPELRVAVSRLYQAYVDSVRDALQRRGLSGDMEEARVIFAALNGLVLQLLTVVDPETIRSALVHVGSILGTTDAVQDGT